MYSKNEFLICRLVRCLDLYVILSSGNTENVTSSFPAWMPFASYFCLIALVWTSSAILNTSAESSIIACAGIRSVFCVPLLSIVLTTDLSCVPFPTSWNILYLIVGRFFFSERMMNFIECVFLHLLSDLTIFVLQSVNTMHHILFTNVVHFHNSLDHCEWYF